MKKVITVQLHVHTTKVDIFLDLAKTMVAKSNLEEGCTLFKLFKEVDKDNKFFIYEVYSSQKAVAVHQASQHFKTFLEKVMPLLAKEPILENH